MFVVGAADGKRHRINWANVLPTNGAGCNKGIAMSDEPTVYELHTIKDIFDKIPADRINDFMSEFSQMVVQTKALSELLQVSAKVLNDQTNPASMFPETFTWVDDGKPSLTVRVDCGGEELLTMKTQARDD